jgi:hypothetical protein
MQPRTARAVFAPWFLFALLGCGRDMTDDATRDPAASQPAATARPAATLVAPPPPPPARVPATGEGWNAAQIDWQPYEAGILHARTDHKPVCLVFYTTWCPHCRNFSHVFDDPRIVSRARDFVMVRIDADAEPALATKYSKDGGYIPRTFFLGPDGTLDESIHPPRPRFQYFYDESDPGSLVAGMETAAHKFAR